MANKLFQTVVQQMKDSVNRDFGVMDETGAIVACSNLRVIGDLRTEVKDEIAYGSGAPTVIGGATYRPIMQNGKSEYIVFAEGDDALAEQAVSILSVAFSNIKNLYDEKYDLNSFIKNIILDNILPGDIYIKGKELHFENEKPRVVFLFRFQQETELLPFEIIQGLFPDKNKDFVINVSRQDIVLVREAGADYSVPAAEKAAAEIAETLSAEFYAKVSIGISSVAETSKDLSRAYKEARTAIEVGKVFDVEKNIVSYENLGIGRIVYQLPTTLCEVFLQEVFKKESLEALDHETLTTVQAFFENNLNVSETSRKLFVHRNTLVYRLEKIRKLTGLDLRQFDHAITFKVALMVKKYLGGKANKY